MVTSDRLRVLNPGTGEELGSAPVTKAADLDAIVRRALDGAAAMRAAPSHERARVLLAVADRMEADAEALARLDASENGKPIRQTREEVAAAIRIFRGYAGEATRLYGRQTGLDAVPGLERDLAITMYEPLGVVGAIVPFNYPIELYSHKAAAAIAAGNSVIVKPPSRCPLGLFRIQEFFDEVGAPEFAHQTVVGSRDLVEAIATHRDIAAISLTGSTAAGRNVATLAAGHFAKVFLELGGNDALIVCDDADVAAAAGAVVAGRLARGNGQICCAVKRVYAHRDVYDEFVAELVRQASTLTVGDQLDEATDVGPLIAASEAERVAEAVSQLAAEGATIALGGGEANGAFVDPTILVDTPVDSPAFAEEIFGPVVPVAKVADDAEAVALANRSPYGLQAAVWTRDVSRAFTLARALDVGGVMINGTTALRAENLPFGGTKETGGVREGLRDTVREFSRLKTIVVKDAFQ